MLVPHASREKHVRGLTNHGALKIISGEQTGAGRAALDAARAQGVPIGGWIARQEALAWLELHAIDLLNVAGPRASEDPDIYGATFAFVSSLLDGSART